MTEKEPEEEVRLNLGVKTDPIEYRYSFRWLFRLLAEEGISCVQLGTFFELYHLPDDYFRDLRHLANTFGVVIDSIFTAHRELGGFFIEDTRWTDQAFRNYRRLIEIAAVLGAERVGSNPGAVLRDAMRHKPHGIRTYLEHMKALSRYAADLGIQWLTIEPMSCTAEPPSSPDEIRTMARELMDYHEADPERTTPVGYCFDVSHGFVDGDGSVLWSHMDLLEYALPYIVELHLKNTDDRYQSTFGFSDVERERGIVEIPSIAQKLKADARLLPVRAVTGYLEIPGPKLGRDYSDRCLGDTLKASLEYLKGVFC